MLESHSRSLKMRILAVSQKILNQNNGPMGWGPGPGKGGQKKSKTLPLVVVPPANPKPKIKAFFSISSR